MPRTATPSAGQRAALGVLAVVMLLALCRTHASPGPFVHTYNVPHKYTQGVLDMPLNATLHPWTRWYDTDQVRPSYQSCSLAACRQCLHICCAHDSAVGPLHLSFLPT